MSSCEKIYHLCFKESSVPGGRMMHNEKLKNAGVTVSLKYRRGPIFYEDAYLVFWHEDGRVWCSRINPVLYGLDAFFFNDGHEMIECRNWEELTKKIKEMNEKGYCYDTDRTNQSRD